MNIELPKDAEGREIPLDTKVMYDSAGNKYEVLTWSYLPNSGGWLMGTLHSRADYLPESLRLTPPDSWEKLEEDLDDFIGCRGRYAGYSALRIACAAVDRIRKLRGEDE